MSTSEQFHGYACLEKGKPLEKWSYTPRPLGDGDVEIQISHCGICHSDIHTLDSGWGPTKYPVIVGHEIVGKVTAAGKNVTGLKVGDRVGVGAQVSCCDEKDCVPCCKDSEQHCSRGTFTYNSAYPSGDLAYGGYQERVRVPSTFAFKIPENLPSDAAAPLLCAGATVYSPLARHGAGPGKRVGVIGIGGLGHFAVQFAAKMGAEVIAVSTSTSKAEDAKKLGASGFCNSKDPADMKKYAGTFDLMICTACDHRMDMAGYLSLMKLDSTFCIVGAPEAPVPVATFALIFSRIKLTGSLIGSRKEITEMLEFAGKHDVKAWIHNLPMEKVNEGIEMVRQNKPRFRVVLHN